LPTGDVLIFRTFLPLSYIRVEVSPDSDPHDSEYTVPIFGSKRKVSKAALEKQNAAATKRARRCDDDGDEYTALSKSLGTNGSGVPKPPI
jgi:hypothetical protein